MLLSEKSSLWETLPDERRRLVRLCARLTGDVDAAEDLAQETLLEAWRQSHKLHDPSGYTPWLSAIARNVCLRWRERCRREPPRLAQPQSFHDGDVPTLLDAQPDEFDLEVELERHELAQLLDRALALLSADTRAALIERYIEGTPLAEVAARLQMSDSGLKSRLHRGRLTLRRVLVQQFPGEATAYGLLQHDTAPVEETRIWCSRCGQVKLQGSFDRKAGELALGCPRCAPGEPTGHSWCRLPEVFRGVKGYRAALSRQMTWLHGYTSRALQRLPVACIYCGGPTTLHLQAPTESPSAKAGHRGIHLRCATCHAPTWTSLAGLALSQPEGQRFWRRYPRVETLPQREVEVDGVAGIVVSHQERGGPARFDVVFACNTYAVIDIQGSLTAEEG